MAEKREQEDTRSTWDWNILSHNKIFYFTTKHLFVIDATELGWNQATNYLAKDGIAAAVEVHCTTAI